jgi:hypothetical protein
MERLILEYWVGDGFTYTAQLTMPIVYKSKQEAQDDLELLILDYIDQIKAHTEIAQDLSNKRTNAYRKLSNINADKNKQAFDEAANKFKNLQEAACKHDDTLPKNLMFGGATLNASDFYKFEDEKYYPVQTTMHTLDEYFALVEQEAKIQIKTSSPKM